MRMGKFKQEDWRGGDLQRLTQQFNTEVFRDTFWFPNEFDESLEKMLNIKHISDF